MPLDQPDDLDPVDAYRMPLGSHIEELRRCLIKALIGVVVALVPAVYFGFDLIGYLQLPLLRAMDVFGYTPQTITPDASAGFFIYVRVSLVTAVILASPWVLWQLWTFIAVGLYDNEKKTVYILAPFSTVMTLLAVLFTYFVLLPVCLFFFYRISTNFPEVDATQHGFMISTLESAIDTPPPPAVDNDAPVLTLTVRSEAPDPLADGMAWIDAGSMRIKAVVGGEVRSVGLMSERSTNPYTHLNLYINFATLLMLGIVIAFQVPVFMLVVGWTGLIDPAQVAMLRKYALFGSAVLGAALTPTDPVSMLLLWGPLYGLFEFGLLLMRLVDKRPTADGDE